MSGDGYDPSVPANSVYGGCGGTRSGMHTSQIETREERTAHASNERSDAQWVMAQKFTAQAAEQSRIVMSRTSQAVKYKQTAEEAKRAAAVARQRQSKMEAMLRDLQLDSIEGQMSEVTSRYYTAKRNMMDATFKLDMSQREVDGLKEQSEDLMMKQKGPMMELETLRTKLSFLTDSLSAANQTYEDFKANSEAERQQAEKFRIEASVIQNEKAALETSYETATNQIIELEMKLRTAQEAKVMAQSQHKAVKSKLTGLEFDLASLYQNIDGHANTAKAIDSLVQDLTTKREQRRKVMLEVESYLSSLEKQTSEVQKQTEEKLKSFMLNQSALESIKAEVHHYSEELRSNQAAMESATQEVEPLQIELQELREEIRKYEMRAEELTVRAEAMSDEADIAQARKEEFWFKAMTAGKGADKISDEGYMTMAEAAGMDMNAAAQLLSKNDRTAQVAGRSVIRDTLVIRDSLIGYSSESKGLSTSPYKQPGVSLYEDSPYSRQSSASTPTHSPFKLIPLPVAAAESAPSGDSDSAKHDGPVSRLPQPPQ